MEGRYGWSSLPNQRSTHHLEIAPIDLAGSSFLSRPSLSLFLRILTAVRVQTIWLADLRGRVPDLISRGRELCPPDCDLARAWRCYNEIRTSRCAYQGSLAPAGEHYFYGYRYIGYWIIAASFFHGYWYFYPYSLSFHPLLTFDTTGLTLFALGHGLVPLLLSIATVLVDPAHIGMLYNVMAVSETVGTLINGPLLSNSFRAGMRAGGILTGLPFIISGVIFFLASIAVFAVRVPRGTLSDGIGRSNH